MGYTIWLPNVDFLPKYYCTCKLIVNQVQVDDIFVCNAYHRAKKDDKQAYSTGSVICYEAVQSALSHKNALISIFCCHRLFDL